MKKLKHKKIIISLFITLIIISIVIGVFYINKNNKENSKVNLTFKSRLDELNSFKTDGTRDGWVQVQGTNIDLPVITYTENISGDVDYHYAWLGSYFSSDRNRRVISSHNVLNVSNKPITDMTNLEDFEALMAFVYYDFAKENLYIKYTNFETQKEELYKIYAVGFYDYYDGILVSFRSDELVEEYIKMVKENSIYNYNVEVDSSDEIITLVTCTRFFGASEKQQIFIDARKVREDEEIIKYKVEKTDLFYELGMYE